MIVIKEAIEIVKKLKENGYESYIVGGAVRDYLLGLPSNDIDITTKATPSEVSKLFKAYPSGLRFGSVTVKYKNKTYEVTTFRKDFDYLDSRRPNKILYANTPQEDAIRRDFTINSLMFDESLKVHDFTGGIKDLKNKVIKAVGIPNERFKEDALRIFRAFYFSSKLGFKIEDKTFLAIKENAKNTLNIACERILQELRKMSKGKYLSLSIKYIIDSSILDYFTELKDYFIFMDKNKIYFEADLFFIMAYYFNNNMENRFIFTNKELKEFRIYNELLKQNTKITSHLIYKIGLDRCIIYNTLLTKLNNKNKLDKTLINKTFEEMKIKNRKDIKITNEEIISIMSKKAGPWVKEVEERIITNILDNKLNNNKADIKKYLEGECI